MCYICRKKGKLYFEISDIEGLSGDEAHIYSIRIEGHEYTLLEEFFEENQVYQKELNSILEKLNTMGNLQAVEENFLNMKRGSSAMG